MRWLSLLPVLLACAGPALAPRDAGSDAPHLDVPAEAAPAQAHIATRVDTPEEAPARRLAPLQAGETITLPAGVMRVGSTPGTAHRRPSVEADLVEHAVGPLDIDRLPFPNDPSRDPLRVASRAEAERHCASAGRRLCEELEWERACRGDAADLYPTGATLDVSACRANPLACESSVGAVDVGLRFAEWTASDAEPGLARLDRTAVVRGAAADAELHVHRCASRQARSPAGGTEALGFRCCGGAAPAAPYPAPRHTRPFRDLDFDVARWRAVLREVEALAPYADAFEPYGLEDGVRAVTRGGTDPATLSWELAPGPFAWSPSPGEEVWVLAGRSGPHALIVALYPLPNDRVLHAGSFVLRDEASPIAILRTLGTRNELQWSACWGCMGESGVVRFEDDATLVVAQR